MRRTLALSATLVALAVLLPAAVAEEGPPTLTRWYGLTVQSGHESDFEAAMKKQVAWYEKNAESWEWHTWRWETGKKSGQYIFRSPGHYWKDMDERDERSARARAHFQETVLPHLMPMQAGIVKSLPELSHWPDGLGMVPMVSVYEFNLHYGMAEEFVGAMGKIHDAIAESKWPVQYALSFSVSGGEMPTFWLVIPHQSWADMKGPDQPFWSMIEQTLGRADGDALRASMMKCVRVQHSSLARFLPELSYIPAGG